MRHKNRCYCGTSPNSSKHILLNWLTPSTSEARCILLAGYNHLPSWYTLTNKEIPTRELLTFMAVTGLLRVRQIITTDLDARNVGDELGEEI